mmetsp:Transcript_20482/g.30652  ORF Transcript_20482/g.30652 Transcript_20482/m.30652 type:complete len:345 (+) Transcript_20482:86-1120(+)
MAHYPGASMPNNFRGETPEQTSSHTFVPRYTPQTSHGQDLKTTGLNQQGSYGGLEYSSQQPQARQQAPQGQQQPQGGYMTGWQPGMNIGGDALGGMMGRVLREEGEKTLKQGATRLLACIDISSLKVYFAVDNYYVLKKLRVILFPFRHEWSRRYDAPGGIGSGGMGPPSDHALFKPPREDVNAPDLYIPTMAFITYIILFAYALGVDNRFTPEVVSLTASWTLIALFTEVGLFWAGFWFLNVEANRRPYLLDILAYTSYKFVGIIVGMLFGLTMGSTAYYVVTCTFGLTMGIFLMKTLSSVTNTPNSSSANHRRYFLAIMGLLQVLLALFMSRSALPAAVTTT